MKRLHSGLDKSIMVVAMDTSAVPGRGQHAMVKVCMMVIMDVV